jgi:DNA-directed RNA polymerase subunit RPC12/RpoP
MKCDYCGSEKSLIEIYVDDNINNDEREYICSDCFNQNQDDFGFCTLCGNHILYRTEDLDAKSLCYPIHKGEFDCDEEEQEDMYSFIEYHTKDN